MRPGAGDHKNRLADEKPENIARNEEEAKTASRADFDATRLISDARKAVEAAKYYRSRFVKIRQSKARSNKQRLIALAAETMLRMAGPVGRTRRRGKPGQQQQGTFLMMWLTFAELTLHSRKQHAVCLSQTPC